MLFLIAALRAKGIPARGRCGFGAYFNPPFFEDHWVCEYWDADKERWILVDTQFDEVWREKLNVRIALKYTGNLPALPDARPKRELVEEQSFVSGLTGYLSGLHADRIERSAKGEACEIKLFFRL
jgi:hypothetical protein